MTFSQLAKHLERIEQTPSRLAMTEVLAELFKLASLQEIAEICLLVQGRVAPLYSPIEFGVADNLMIKALAISYEVPEAQVLGAFKLSGDLGATAQSFATNLANNKTVGEVFKELKSIAELHGPGSQDQKIKSLAGLIKSVDALSVRYIVRIPLGKLRLGFSDMTILDGLSWMVAGDKSLREVLEQAYNVHPDIGLIAKTIKEAGVDGLKEITSSIGVPILSALCQRLPSADEMIAKMGEVIVEPKYDGVRVQIHWKKINGECRVYTFSRNLEQTTHMFPELIKYLEQLPAINGVIDAEAVGVNPATGLLVPFQTTTTRKRKHDVSEAQSLVPLRFYLFDLLYLDNQELLNQPLQERRAKLEKLVSNNEWFTPSPYIITHEADKIRAYHQQQLANGLEGVVIKKWDGLYESGRRSFNWVKFKEEEGKTGKLKDTIDAIVMGYYLGEGKRTGFGIGAFLVGIKDGEVFKTITKIGTGVSDDQWRELFSRFGEIKSNDKPKEFVEVDKSLLPDVWLMPAMVVEVAGDDLTMSPNHGAGYAIRFPRLVGIRDDKSRDQVTTLEEVVDMYKNQ